MFRRALAGHGHGRLAGSGTTGGAPVDLRLLRFGDGTFTRGGEASYQTGASTLAWAASNELRWEDRGDGNGAVPLFEGGSENLLSDPEDLFTANWSTASVSTPVAANSGTAPDGAGDANLVTFDASTTSRIFQAQADMRVAPTDNAPAAVSLWVKKVSGAGHGTRFPHRDKAGTNFGNTALSFAPSAWERYTEVLSDVATGTGAEFRFQNDGNAQVGENLATFAQWEELPFPSSYIRNGAARPADVLTFSSAQMTASGILTGKSRWVFWPDFSSLESTFQTSHFIFGIGTAGGIRLMNSPQLRIRIGTNNFDFPCTWDRGDRLQVDIDLPGGVATLSGALTGNGSIAITGDWAGDLAANTHIGDRAAGDSPFYGRISEPRAW